MKTFIRTTWVILIFLSTVFLKKDCESEYFLPRSASSAFAADVDLDGFRDIVVGHHVLWGDSNPSLTILKNIYWGNFQITDSSLTFCGYQDKILAIDVNNDQYPDIVAFRKDFSIGTPRNYIRVYNNSNGSFSSTDFSDYNLNSPDIINGINYGDINGDGYLDIVVFSTNYNFWGILYNDGTGSFMAPEYFIDNTINVVECADVNDDGRDDILVCGEDTRIYISHSTGFSSHLLDPYVFMQQGAIDDFDGDQKKDIVTEVFVWTGGYSILRFFKNIGNNEFQQLPDLIFTPGLGPLHISDFNNDGFPDFLFSGIGGHIIYYNLGNFQLGDSTVVHIPNYGESITNVFLKDIDNNAFSDIITVRFDVSDDPGLDLRFNDGHGNFIAEPIVGLQNEKNWGINNFRIWPNPFISHIYIDFSLLKDSYLDISIFTSDGKFVKNILNDKLMNGRYILSWNGCDYENKECSSGTYIIVLKEKEALRKIVIIIKY